VKEDLWRKYPVLFSLYIAQSVPMSFFSTVVPVIMRQEHYSLASIGLLQLVKLPWIFKFLWAPLVDATARTNKQLKNWIILSELFYAVVILSIGFFSLDVDFKLIVILLLIAFTASATQDIATDAFAILNLKPKERAYGNSMQSAGSFVGSLLGTGVLLIVYHYYGWEILMVLLAVFVIIAIIPIMLYRYKAQPQAKDTKRIKFTDIFRFFAIKRNLLQIPILLIYYAGIIGVLTMLKPYLVDLGYDTKQIGFMSGIFGTAIAAGISIFGGFIVKRITTDKALIIFLFFNLISGGYFWYISTLAPTLTQLYIGIALLWGSYGLSSVVIYTRAMNHVRPGCEGTDFTIQIVLTHLSSMLVAIFSGKIADALGYTGLFRIETGFTVFTILIVSAVVIYGKKLNKTNEDIA